MSTCLHNHTYIHTYINKYISEKNTYKGKHMNLLEQYMYLCMHVWIYVLHCVCIWLAVGVCGAVLKRGHEVSLLSGANSPFHLVHWSTCIHKCICSIHIIHKFIILPNNRANLQYSRLDEYWLNCRTNTHIHTFMSNQEYKIQHMADNTSSSVGMAIFTWPSSPRRHLAAGAVGRVDRTNSLSTWLRQNTYKQNKYI